jgi:hypothetical protein
MMKSEQTIENFVAVLYEGVSAWEKAGKLLVALIDRNPDVKQKIVREHPEISMGVLSRLEMVGRGFVKPAMLLSDAPAYRAARVLPVSDQDKLISDPHIPLLVRENGATEILQVDFRNLQAGQVRQVFASDHIRDEAEQRAWLEAQARPSMKRDWWVEDGMVVFRKGAKFTVSQLSGVIQQVAENSTGRRRAKIA